MICNSFFDLLIVMSLLGAVDHSVNFKEAAKDGNLIPLYRSIFSDHLTPVLAYRCLVKEDERDAPSFLFESVEPGLKASSVVRSLFYISFADYFSKEAGLC